MKQYKVKPSNRPVLTDKTVRSPRHFFQSEKLGDCKAFLIDESENLHRAAVFNAVSHVDMVHQAIDEFEAQIALKDEISALRQDLLNLLRHAESIDLANDIEFDETLAELEFIRSQIARLESAIE